MLFILIIHVPFQVQLKLKSVLAETVMSSNSALPEAVMDSQEMEDESVDTTKNRVESESQADVTEQVGNQTANQSTIKGALKYYHIV